MREVIYSSGSHYGKDGQGSLKCGSFPYFLPKTDLVLWISNVSFFIYFLILHQISPRQCTRHFDWNKLIESSHKDAGVRIEITDRVKDLPVVAGEGA